MSPDQDKKRSSKPPRKAAAAQAGPPASRWHRYPRGHFRRQLRHRTVDAIAVLALVILGLSTALVIISEQKAALPGWVPLLGQDFFHLEAEFATGQSVAPGQGQAVTVSGIRIGKIDSVSLDGGTALVGLDIEPKYTKLIREDASFLLRPKTNLNDMVVEVTPGDSEELIAEGTRVPLASTQPNINPDEILATLDADTRTYLRLLLQGVGQGLDGRGRQLAGIWRRLYPFTRDIARVNTAVAQRREALAQVIHNFRLLSEELANHDSDIVRFVDASEETLGHFANQSDSIAGSLRELPSTLQQTNSALGSANRLSTQLGPALRKLTPQADAFAPALRRFQQFFTATTPTIEAQLTPFARQIAPPLRTLRGAAKPLRNTVRGFRDILKPLNYGFNELAYKPPAPGTESFLFYLPWLNHNLSSGYLLQDAAGPLRRGTILLTCHSAGLAEGFAGGRPFLSTVLELSGIPTSKEIC